MASCVQIKALITLRLCHSPVFKMGQHPFSCQGSEEKWEKVFAPLSNWVCWEEMDMLPVEWQTPIQRKKKEFHGPTPPRPSYHKGS